VQETLQPALIARISAALGQTGWKLEVDPDMDDGQCLLFHYPGDFAPTEAGYVRPFVKIELGARSDDWPHQEKTNSTQSRRSLLTLTSMRIQNQPAKKCQQQISGVIGS
jgi:hypothetical protein